MAGRPVLSHPARCIIAFKPGSSDHFKTCQPPIKLNPANDFRSRQSRAKSPDGPLRPPARTAWTYAWRIGNLLLRLPGLPVALARGPEPRKANVRTPKKSGPTAANGLQGPLLGLAVRRIVGGFRPLRILRFGWRARGEGGRWGDVDLMLVLPEVQDNRQATEEVLCWLKSPHGDLPEARRSLNAEKVVDDLSEYPFGDGPPNPPAVPEDQGGRGPNSRPAGLGQVSLHGGPSPAPRPGQTSAARRNRRCRGSR